LDGKPENYSPFRPGMTATVDIITKRMENIVAVPISAVVIKDDTTSVKKDVVAELEKEEQEKKGTAPKSDKKFECVFVKVGDKAKLRVVKTGIQDDSNIEIVSGLKPGEEIIIGPYITVSKDLASNDKVKIESEKDKKAKTEDKK
jgi:HlyD family secretion protein